MQALSRGSRPQVPQGRVSGSSRGGSDRYRGHFDEQGLMMGGDVSLPSGMILKGSHGMNYDATYHRNERLRALARWSEAGVLEPRRQLPIEKAFADRVREKSDIFFRPMAVTDQSSIEYHRQLSYLIDAFDALPGRVDIAFDSTWKALELASKELSSGNITERLKVLSERLESGEVDLISEKYPAQSCEYLYQRFVVDALKDSADPRLERRLDGLGEPLVSQLVDYLKSEYGDETDERRRKGAMLLRRALRGGTLRLGDVEGFALTTVSRAKVLLSLFLYTARNDRFHGESFSPFVSSKATMRTYTHPYFAFLASYYALVGTWQIVYPGVVEGGAAEAEASFRENMEACQRLFGNHWSR